MKWFQDYQCPNETCEKKNRWENAIHQFNNGKYKPLNTTNIQRYFNNLRKAYDSTKNHFKIHTTSTFGCELNKKKKMIYVNSLPPILKTDYLKHTKDYCIITYGFILTIMKVLNGTEDYQLKLKNTKRLLLYFDMERRHLETLNNLCVRSSKILIDIPNAYIMLKKKKSISNSKDTTANFNSIQYQKKQSKKMKINLPCYMNNNHTPRVVFSYLHLAHAFATTYCNDNTNDIDINQYVICPIDILSYLYEYYKQLQYIEKHF